MKKLFLSTMVLLICVTVFAQSAKYTAAMKNSLAAMDSSFKNPADLLSAANNFERIATAEKSQWLPYYYAAFCQLNYAFSFMQSDPGKMDAIADKASLLTASADSLSPANSEISCIKSMIASCHLSVKPAERWQEYGPISSDNLDAAIKQDATNPRPYFLQGQTLLYTPAAFGGGCDPAKPLLQKALDKYAAFKPASDISPDWGKEMTEKMIASCNNPQK